MNIDKLKFSIKDISVYRSELMGWAILWIMMLHFTFTQIKPFGFIAQYGFAGVEIFMLVSGYGLYFSLEKDSHLLRFYKKRLLRIFPTYYLLGLFPSIFILHDSFFTYLWRYTTIGYWIGGIYGDWYIPAIVFLYLIAPIIKTLIDKKRFEVLVILSFLILLLSYYYVDKEDSLDRSHFFLLYRIPTFIFGMFCAYCQKNKISNKVYWIILTVGLPCFVLLYPHHHEVYNYKYFSLVFLLPASIYFFTTISKYTKRCNSIISAMGTASLEIYLIQGNFFYLCTHGYVPDNIWHDTIVIGFIIISSLLGILTHWLIGKSGINRLF